MKLRLDFLASSQANASSHLINNLLEQSVKVGTADACTACQPDLILKSAVMLTDGHQWASSMALAKYMMDNRKKTSAWTSLAKIKRIIMGMGAK